MLGLSGRRSGRGAAAVSTATTHAPVASTKSPPQPVSDPVEDILAKSPFLREEELADIESFLRNFPNLHEHYIPVQIIGEGTFSTVYKAIDVKHYDAVGNERWEECSLQEREDAVRFFAHMQRVQASRVARRPLVEKKIVGNVQSDPAHNIYDPDRLINRCLSSFTAAHLALMEAKKDPLMSPSFPQKRLEESTSDTLPRFVALKRIIPTSSPERLEDELSFIHMMGGKANVLPLITGLRHEDQVVAVFPYFSAPEFRDLLPRMSIVDISDYMRLLLEALENIHSHRVVHRDIKPSNFMFSPRGDNADGRARGLLVDFGLAQDLKTVDPNKEIMAIWKKADPRWREYAKRRVEMLVSGNSTPGTFPKDKRPPLKAARAGTRGFRAPEVLFKCITEQGPALDIWSAGVILLTMLSRRYPFFQSSDDCDAIVEIACIFGDENIGKVAEVLGRRWLCTVPSVPVKHVGWPALIANMCPEAFHALDIPESCFDFLDKLLTLDPRQRITATQALRHPFIELGRDRK